MIISYLAVMSAAILAASNGEHVRVNSHLVEDSVSVADRAFIADLHWDHVDHLNSNETIARGRVIPKEAVWGPVPHNAIDTEDEYFPLMGSRSWSVWQDLGPRENGKKLEILVLTVPEANQPHVIYAIATHGNAVAISDDIVAIRNVENEPDSPSLRERLITTVATKDNSELLWKYALRRLYRMEEQLAGRTNLLLNEKFQESGLYAPPGGGHDGGRLGYSILLLTGETSARQEDFYRQIPLVEHRAVLDQLIGKLASTKSEYLAESVLCALPQLVRKAELDVDAREQLITKLRIAIDNPDHPARKIARRDLANQNLKLISPELEIDSPAPPARNE